MKLAVNYCEVAADLVRRDQIRIDYFKCPAWPALVERVTAEFPTFVHFPLQVGAPTGGAIDSETGLAPDWDRVDHFLATTETRHVNLHLAPEVGWFPDVPVHSVEPRDVEQVAEGLIRDVQDVVHRFGPQRVIVENDYAGADATLLAACLPEVISRVVAETGCGMLLDLSHARLAAHKLGSKGRAYLSSLPLTQIEEIHVTGIRRLAGRWLETAQRRAPDDNLVRQYAGGLIDHLPMTRADWRSLAWALDQVRHGHWRAPWAVTFEYGGVSSFFESVTKTGYLATQVPRLYAMVNGANSSP
jgi:uncharacterized protein (UPF0276 family)